LKDKKEVIDLRGKDYKEIKIYDKQVKQDILDIID
jgi:hypothetical protein